MDLYVTALPLIGVVLIMFLLLSSNDEGEDE